LHSEDEEEKKTLKTFRRNKGNERDISFKGFKVRKPMGKAFFMKTLPEIGEQKDSHGCKNTLFQKEGRTNLH